jgi:galactosamine-6-phosphate isomerase
MNVRKFKSSQALSDYASELIVKDVIEKPDLLMCVATGSSPTETYKKLTEKIGYFKTDHLRIIKLDEWGGISLADPQSCETYIRQNIILPLKINEKNYISFNSNPANPPAEVIRIQKLLDKNGPIDLCILGLGANGHIAFNEPADFLEPNCHIASLAESSLQHKMAKNMGEIPSYGLTLGMADILQSKKIILIISGKNKQTITTKFLKKEISTALPASFLWLHTYAECLILEEI